MSICACGKESYATREEANKALLTLRRTVKNKTVTDRKLESRNAHHMSVYRCDRQRQNWHYGHHHLVNRELIKTCLGCGKPFQSRNRDYWLCPPCTRDVKQHMKAVNSK